MSAAHEIRAIETVFDGHKFRSRLEARWALFFKVLSIEYHYEPEGFELGGGCRYLPDFHLPTLGVYAEVKPRFPLSRAEWRKLILFAVDGGMPLLLIVGAPGRHEMLMLDRGAADSWASMEESFNEGGDEEADLCLQDDLREWANVDIGALPIPRSYSLVYRTLPPIASGALVSARNAGAQARFEDRKRWWL